MSGHHTTHVHACFDCGRNRWVPSRRGWTSSRPTPTSSSRHSRGTSTGAPALSDESVRSSEVEVAVDPATAFTIFTEELDLWWVRGPINSYGAGKLVAMRCEPGVGGRLLEVYDRDSGDGLELARIVAWVPGEHLAWKSSLDDVIIDVWFELTNTGTTVRLRATVPAGGSDKGGSAFVDVTPPWLSRWVARRDRTPHELHDLARFALTLYYARPAAAARWLAAAFGFESPSPLPEG